MYFSFVTSFFQKLAVFISFLMTHIHVLGGIMIKIQLYKDIEPEFFNGRDFGESIDIVKDVLSDVK